MPNRCAVYGHRLTRPKYFGERDQFYIRHCQNCEYVATGKIVVSVDADSITVEKTRIKPSDPTITGTQDNAQHMVDKST